MKVKCKVKDCNNKIKVSLKKWLYYKIHRYGDICHDCYIKITKKIITKDV